MDPLNVSGLAQPSVNLGGLLGMGSLSGTGGNLSGGAQAGMGGAGMTGGLDLAQLLEMLNQQQGEQSAVGLGQPLGSAPVSIAQQQAAGQVMGDQQGGYLTAGQPSGGGFGIGGQAADPLAIIQKVLGLAQKGVSLTGNSNTSLLPGDTTDASMSPQQGFQTPTAGNMQDFSGLDALYQQLQVGNQAGSGFGFYPNNTPTSGEFAALDQPNDYSSLLPDSAMQGPAGMPNARMLQSMGEVPDEGGGFLSGFNPTLGNALGVAGGLAGLAGGIQSGNPYGITGGSLATAGNVASMLGYPGVGGAIGGLGGPLSLASGIQSGNPMSLASGAVQTYQTVAQLASYFPELSQYLPSLGQLASDALTAIAPGAAEALGLTAAPAAAGAAEGTAAAAGAGTGAALGVAALPAAILGGVFMKKDADEMQSIINGMKETIARRRALPGDINSVTQGIQATAGLPADLSGMSTQDLMRQFELMNAAHVPAMNNIQALINNPSSAPSRIPRMDTSGLRQLTAAEYNSIPLGIAALQDEFARRGLPMEQYWNPLSESDILGLVGNAPVTPEQLASIGPGNMLPSLQALRLGQPLTNLPPALPGVGQARLSAAQAAPEGAESRYGAYFLSPQQQQELAQRQQLYPEELQQSQSVGQTEGAPSYYGPPPQSPFQLWQQMLGMYQVPQTPAGMYGQPQVPQPQAPQQAAPQQPMMPPTTGIPVPQTPQQALTLQMLLSRTPGFTAQGSEENPYLPLLFAQYGLA